MARNRNVGADNAEKISRGVANILGLSEQKRLELKAEIMGGPDNLPRAYFGHAEDAANILEEELPIGVAIVSRGKTPAHDSGNRVVRKLEEMGVPAQIVRVVRRKVRPRPARPPGKTTHRQSGLEARNRRAEALFTSGFFKPKTAEALERSGLSRKELYQWAGVGRETLRKALYEYVNRRSAQKIARGGARRGGEAH